MAQSASEIVEQAIAKQEAEDAGIDTSGAEDKKQDDKSTDKSAGQQGAGGDDKKTSDKGTADDKDAAGGESGKSDKKSEADKADDKKDADKGKDADKDKKAEDEGKFTADDALEVEDKPAEPKAPTDNAGIQLSPAESEYIVKNIGEPVLVRGVRGTGDNQKEVEIKAYSAQDIPADFRFANDQQLLAAQEGFRRLEGKAQQLLGNYRQQQSAKETQDFERRENEGIRADVADLQKDGRFPKFRVQPGQPGFDEDPAAQQMAEVLNIMTERNENYLKQYQQGRPYRHIGFTEAFEIWERNNPDKQAEKAKDEDQKKEDEERGKVADKVTSNRGLTQPKIQKATIRSGVTIDDILNAHEAEDLS